MIFCTKMIIFNYLHNYLQLQLLRIIFIFFTINYCSLSTKFYSIKNKVYMLMIANIITFITKLRLLLNSSF